MAYVLVAGIFGALVWGFKPRIVRSLRSRPGPQEEPPITQHFQTIYGADELLRELETVEAKGRQWGSLITDNMQEEYISIVEREASYHYHELLKLSVYYGKTWDLTLQNRIKVIYTELDHGAFAFRKGRISDGKAHIETALEDAKSLVAYLKSPPSS